MPIPGARYRWKKTPSGKKVRLAFKGSKVVEIKKQGGVAHRVNQRKTSRRKKR